MSSDSWVPLIVSVCSALIAAVSFSYLGSVGWREFARAYPDRAFRAESASGGVRAYVGESPFPSGGRARVEIGEDGLRLVPIFPMRRLMPAVVVPWSVVTAFQRVRDGLTCQDEARLSISGAAFRLCIRSRSRRGEVISALERYWEQSRKGFLSTADSQSKSSLIAPNRI